MTSLVTIDHIECPSIDELENNYVRRGRPVVLRQPLGTCPAASWTPEYLAAAIGDRSVRVAVSASGSYSYNPGKAEIKERDMALSAAIDLMRSTGEHDPKYYIMQRSIHAEFPEVAADLEVPRVLVPGDLRVANLWLGSGGTLTPLHFDIANNLLCQVHGRKSVKVLAPDQTEYLYPLPTWSSYAHLSEVDLEAPDYHRFPLLEKTTAIEVILEPGTALFLPGFWWHQVRSLELSISINLWWQCHASQLLAPHSIRHLPAMFDRNRLADIADEVKGGLIALASYAWNEARTPWVATLCAAGAFDRHVRRLLQKRHIDDISIPGRPQALYSAVASLTGEPVPRLETKALDTWMRLIASARTGSDRNLSKPDVANMVHDVARFIAASPL